MEFISLVFKEKFRVLFILVALGLTTGAIQVGLLLFINNAIALLIKGTFIDLHVILYVFSLLLLYLLLNRFLSQVIIRFSQKVIHDLRMTLMRAVLDSSYLHMKEKSEMLNSAISKDTIAVSHTAMLSIQFITSIVTVFGCLIYLLFLSVYAFLIITVIALLGVLVYWLGASKNNLNLKQGRDSEDSLFHYVNEVINGFREIKLNPDKGAKLVDGPLEESSTTNYIHTSKGYIGYYNSGMVSQLLIYLALFALLFLGGSWFNIQAAVLVSCIVITLYIIGPLEMVMTLIPDIGAGNIAALRLLEILNSFQHTKAENKIRTKVRFSQLALKSLSFEFLPIPPSVDPAFVIGPIDFVLNKGEVAFIYGGNGSGKTTFFHLVLGLLKAKDGSVLLNGQPVLSEEVINNLFAAVFSDFHLFDKLYGVDNPDTSRIQHYLHLFELEDKVTFDTDHFSSIDLSTGQRKRLALIGALLENRPLLFLDEWAADQDPAFRRKFYEIIIPYIKSEGFTILAITHDDKYYHTSDLLYRMEFGELIKEENIAGSKEFITTYKKK